MLPDRARQVLVAGLCPDCASPDATLAPGPRGGLGQIKACIKCGAEFNIVHYHLDRGIPHGEVVAAHRNTPRGAPNRIRLASVFGIDLPPASRDQDAIEQAAAAYCDPSFTHRLCDRDGCGESYRGPAAYCSLHCAALDAT